jgi:hypothetical protein
LASGRCNQTDQFPAFSEAVIERVLLTSTNISTALSGINGKQGFYSRIYFFVPKSNTFDMSVFETRL